MRFGERIIRIGTIRCRFQFCSRQSAASAAPDSLQLCCPQLFNRDYCGFWAENRIIGSGFPAQRYLVAVSEGQGGSIKNDKANQHIRCSDVIASAGPDGTFYAGGEPLSAAMPTEGSPGQTRRDCWVSYIDSTSRKDSGSNTDGAPCGQQSIQEEGGMTIRASITGGAARTEGQGTGSIRSVRVGILFECPELPG
jgi:hypothetical protein